MKRKQAQAIYNALERMPAWSDKKLKAVRKEADDSSIENPYAWNVEMSAVVTWEDHAEREYTVNIVPVTHTQPEHLRWLVNYCEKLDIYIEAGRGGFTLR